jgi:mono/diheme cytochrome c family protein
MSVDDHRPTVAVVEHVHELKRRPVKHVLVTLAIVAVVGALVSAGVLFSGLFNVAATVADAPALRWMFVTVREGSIKSHARDIQAPPLADTEHLVNGFKIYREDCVMCHTPTGRKPLPMALGFNPQAPTFAENDMTVAQLFWAAKNGIRFTGMPAWGPSLSDQDIWDVVGFVMTMPKMNPAEYDALDRGTPSRQPLKVGGSAPENGLEPGSAASSPAQSMRTK